ncbi:hypothetical protein BH18THE2_BH18THE2_29040 [soil metagenome]
MESSFRRRKLHIGKYLTKVMPSVMEEDQAFRAITNRCTLLNYEELTDFLIKGSKSKPHTVYIICDLIIVR